MNNINSTDKEVLSDHLVETYWAERFRGVDIYCINYVLPIVPSVTSILKDLFPTWIN